MTPEPIADSSFNALSLRGVPIGIAIHKFSYAELLLFMLTGEQLTDAAEFAGKVKMVNAILVAWADHGEKPPSTQCTRMAASCGVTFIQAASAAFACFGEAHGPVEAATLFLEDFASQDDADKAQFIAKYVGFGRKVPGYGHPLHTADPRITPLLSIASREKITGRHVQAAHDVEKHLHGHRKEVGVNLAGITAALWLDMALPASAVGLIAVAGRAVGLAAHYSEVVESGQSFLGTPPKT